MVPRVRRRIAVILAGVVVLTGGSAAFSDCRHAADVSAAAPMASGHEGHAMHAVGPVALEPADPGVNDCDCGGTCDSACNQVCHTTVPALAAPATEFIPGARPPTLAQAVVPHTATHPPLRPPIASL